ncbi:hypothetical protein [Pseudomonas triticicola]|uniref:hypothetical protein n=1 Tax=Pseudomonas triticicola TaxID=2842345 RepID=UPI003EBDD596
MAIILDCLRSDQPTHDGAKQKFKERLANSISAQESDENSNRKNAGIPPAKTEITHPEADTYDTPCYLKLR